MAVKAKKTKGLIKKGSTFACSVCGMVVRVDEVCGCVKTCDIVCCSEPMKARKK